MRGRVFIGEGKGLIHWGGKSSIFWIIPRPPTSELGWPPENHGWDNLRGNFEKIVVVKLYWTERGVTFCREIINNKFFHPIDRRTEHSRNISSDQRKPPIQQYQRLGSRLFKTGGAGLLVESHLFAKKTKRSLLALRSVAGGASGASNLNNSASGVQIAQCFSFFTLGGWKDVN